MEKIDEFVEMLANEIVAEDCENQYLIPERKINISNYLEAMMNYSPEVLLIGEAPGWKGCAETGIPFVSYHVMNHCNIFPKGEFVIEGDRWEKSAHYMWNSFEKEEFIPLLSCRVSFDGELLHYLPIGNTIREIDIPGSRDVIKPYNTGDILKVRNIPLTDDFYVIYIYDEKRQGNKHIQMLFNEEIEFCKIHWLEITEKVESCPIEQINEMSKKIKENYEEFNKFFEKQKISPEVHPL